MSIQKFQTNHEIQSVVKRKKLFDIFHTVRGLFESHDDGSLFGRISKEEQQAYFARTDIRQMDLLFGWEELNEVVEDYIRTEIHPDLEGLPFRAVG